MRMVLILALVTLTGCAAVNQSRFNPLNWFGAAQPDPAALDVTNAEVNPLIPARRASIFFDTRPAAFAGRPIEQIIDIRMERRPGGAILRATAEAGRVGPFDVRLILDEAASTAGTLVFDMKALQQLGTTTAPGRARQVTAAQWITDQDLTGIRTVTVRGGNNALSTRR